MRSFAMRQIIDLSHPIRELPSPIPGTLDNQPNISFEETGAHGYYFITSRIDRLYSNICTHMDFPGHLSSLTSDVSGPIGKYPVERFIGQVLILDFSYKLDKIKQFFDEQNKLNINPRDQITLTRFLKFLDNLEISSQELEAIVQQCETSLNSVKGILFYTGLSDIWEYQKFESWQYRYFYSPYLSSDASEVIVDSKPSFVGIDALQLEHPIINFRGDELPVVLNNQCRGHIRKKLAKLGEFSNHETLLGNDIVIYENLKIPKKLRNHVVEFAGVPLNFQIQGMDNNALARPYVVYEKAE
jgi:kynurenine formamidase